MMRWLVRVSLKFRRLVVAIAAGVLILGITQAQGASVDMLPEFEPVQVEVQTEALGLSAAEVEQLITVPLEQDLLNGVAFLERIESTSLPGLSSVVLTFEPGTPILAARQVVQERLTQAHALPQVSQPPQMLQPLSSTSRVAMVRLSSEQLSAIELSVLTRWDIRPRLMGVDGVANVSVWGMRDRQLQVLVDPAHLADQRVTLQQVIGTTANALWWCPLTFEECSTPGVGGFIDGPIQRLAIHHESPIETAEDLAQVSVEDPSGGAATGIRLGDVAQVVEDHPPLIGDAVCEGECLLLVIEKLPDANTAQVADDIDEALRVMQPGLGDVQVDSSIYRPATYIERSFSGLGRALLIGSILMLVVLGLLTWSWRRVLIVALVTAVSLAAAVLVLVATDTTVNLMIVAGMVMALAAIVDDGVTGVDQNARRLREHEGDAHPTWRTILDATVAMRGAMLSATLICIAVVAPAFFLPAEAGAFLPPIVLTYVLAIVASMLVALTVAPAVAMILLPGAGRAGGGPVLAWLSRAYGSVSGRLVSRPNVAIAMLLVMLGVGVVTFRALEPSMRPDLREDDVVIRWDAAPGASLASMQEVTGDAVTAIEEIEGVDGVGAHVGRAVMSDQTVNVSSGQIWVRLEPEADRDATLDSIESAIAGYPEIATEVLTYSDARVAQVLQRDDDDLVVRLYGEDGPTLLDRAKDVRAEMLEIHGVTAAEVEAEPTEPTLEIEVDLDRAESFGVKPGDVRRAAATLLSGISVGALFEEQKVFDVVVWGEPSIRENAQDVDDLLIDVPGGGHVTLSEVADVRIVSSPTAIHHESVSKFVDVAAAVTGRDVAAVAADIEESLGDVEFGLDYHAEVLDMPGQEQSARAGAVAIAALLAVFLLLQAALGSWRSAAVASLMLPASLVGGLVAVLLTDGELTLGAVAGLAAVVGICARQVIASITHYQRSQRAGAEEDVSELVRRGTLDRLPAVATAASSATALLLPFAIASGGTGFEIVGPTAIALLGGLITSTLVSLVAVPSLYLRYGAVATSDAQAEEIAIAIPDLTGTDLGGT